MWSLASPTEPSSPCLLPESFSSLLVATVVGTYEGRAGQQGRKWLGASAHVEEVIYFGWCLVPRSFVKGYSNHY